MKVLHVYAGNLFGGIEQTLVTLAEHHDLTSDVDWDFALCFRGELSGRLAALGYPAHDLGRVRVRRPYTIWRARRRLRTLLASGGYDAVITHSVWLQGVFGPAVRRSGTPLVFWIHDLTDGRHWLDRWARRTRPDLTIANSQYTAATVANLYPGVSPRVVYPPVIAPPPATVAVRRAVRRELNTADDVTVIVQASRLEAWKGHQAHIEGLGRLRGRRDWVCWMVGGPQRPHEYAYFDELKRTAARLGIDDRVRFVGHRTDVRRLLEGADIACQPNTGPEPFGLALVEALFSGLPIVTTALGGAREVADGTCAIIVPPGDPAALAAALAGLLDDPALRAKLSAGAPLRARRLCDAAGKTRALADAIRSVVAARSA